MGGAAQAANCRHVPLLPGSLSRAAPGLSSRRSELKKKAYRLFSSRAQVCVASTTKTVDSCKNVDRCKTTRSMSFSRLFERFLVRYQTIGQGPSLCRIYHKNRGQLRKRRQVQNNTEHVFSRQFERLFNLSMRGSFCDGRL